MYQQPYSLYRSFVNSKPFEYQLYVNSYKQQKNAILLTIAFLDISLLLSIFLFFKRQRIVALS